MKDITTKICKGKANPEFDIIYTLIKSLKDWYNYGVKHTRKNNGMNSPYIKSFTNGVEKFIKASIIDSLEYMDEDITDSLNKISRNKKIEAIVGTINPEYRDVPFISLEEIMKGSGLKKINNIMRNKKD